MNNENISPSKARIRSKMATLRDTFLTLNDCMMVMLTAMPDSEREILQNRWRVTANSFEELFAKYLD